jgi:hypothetical protein
MIANSLGRSSNPYIPLLHTGTPKIPSIKVVEKTLYKNYYILHLVRKGKKKGKNNKSRRERGKEGD